MKNPRLPLFAAIAWFLISLVLFTLPGTAFPRENWLNKIWFDKWVHIGIFVSLTALWSFALYRLAKEGDKARLRRQFILIALLGIAYGTSIEFVQKYFVAFRSFDIGDIIADGIGCAAGYLFSVKRLLK